jgi:hypothetical protein
MAAGARGRALPAYFIIEFIYPRTRITFGIFATRALGFISFSGKFASAFLFFADGAPTLFVGFGLASGEDISGFGNNLDWGSHDIRRQPRDAAAGHQRHQT